MGFIADLGGLKAAFLLCIVFTGLSFLLSFAIRDEKKETSKTEATVKARA